MYILLSRCYSFSLSFPRPLLKSFFACNANSHPCLKRDSFEYIVNPLDQVLVALLIEFLSSSYSILQASHFPCLQMILLPFLFINGSRAPLLLEKFEMRHVLFAFAYNFLTNHSWPWPDWLWPDYAFITHHAHTVSSPMFFLTFLKHTVFQ